MDALWQISAQTLLHWQKKCKALPAGAVAGTLAALQAENRRRQKERHRMVQQRDILKKTLGIISAPSDNGSNG